LKRGGNYGKRVKKKKKAEISILGGNEFRPTSKTRRGFEGKKRGSEKGPAWDEPSKWLATARVTKPDLPWGPPETKTICPKKKKKGVYEEKKKKLPKRNKRGHYHPEGRRTGGKKKENPEQKWGGSHSSQGCTAVRKEETKNTKGKRTPWVRKMEMRNWNRATPQP